MKRFLYLLGMFGSVCAWHGLSHMDHPLIGGGFLGLAFIFGELAVREES